MTTTINKFFFVSMLTCLLFSSYSCTIIRRPTQTTLSVSATAYTLRSINSLNINDIKKNIQNAFASNNSQENIKNTFRRLAQKYHPDHGGTKEAFIILQNTYQQARDRALKFIQKPYNQTQSSCNQTTQAQKPLSPEEQLRNHQKEVERQRLANEAIEQKNKYSIHQKSAQAQQQPRAAFSQAMSPKSSATQASRKAQYDDYRNKRW